jgi:acetyl/propionyl-CoA carboxylase alpha subunit/acetyl-CoA carboxylase carboxyltransferase component
MTEGVLVANRGEIALRIFRSVRAMGMRCVAVHTAEEADAPHVRNADASVALQGRGAAAYIDSNAMVAAAQAQECLYIHPGYGFLSESAALARACVNAGLIFVGPSAELLDVFGDKAAARALAAHEGLPVLPASPVVRSLQQAIDFMDSLSGEPVIVKALSGGGGRGIRVVSTPNELEQALERCRSEAERSFGSSEVYIERYVGRVRHIEVQLVCDGNRAMSLGDRDCSLQRRHQKVIEIAPAPGLDLAVRDLIRDSAISLFDGLGYRGLATVEFLVEREGAAAYWFLEVNPRLQVEHGVTEQVTGVDLVEVQLKLARGMTLPAMGLAAGIPVVGHAVEARITLAGGGADRIESLSLPEGRGLRLETCVAAGAVMSSSFDPLLAKVIAFGSEDVLELSRQLAQHLRSFVLTGPATDLVWVAELLESGVCTADALDTSLIDARLAISAEDYSDPANVVAPSTGVVVLVFVQPGQLVREGETLLVLESLKMEQEITAQAAGSVVTVAVEPGAVVQSGQTLLQIEPIEAGFEQEKSNFRENVAGADPPSLLDLRLRRERISDSARPEPIAKRHARGKRTARENVAELVADGTFHEYGGLVVAAQRRRRSLEDLEANTPADGLVMGIGRLRAYDGTDAGDVVVLAYDYTVLAGTQGLQSHRKAERILDLARRRRSPVVILAEGGGGRPGDTDNQARATGMDLGTFTAMALLNGVVPTVGIASGRCFAGNAVLLGCCDVIIATADATIGLGGPAMIEGGGLGSFSADEVGPVSVQVPNGVVDVLVEDELAATHAARRYLGYFVGPVNDWDCADQTALRHVVPQQRRRILNIRLVIDLLADTDSVLELRSKFAMSAVTVLARIEGRPVGIIANDGAHLGGAIDSDAADKLARFLQLCEGHGLPVISLCDTPGFMVGPDSEKRAAVRHVTRMLVIAARLSVPFVCVVVRRSYGLGGQAMAGGSYRVPDAVLSWPTGDIGAMGPEGAARLGYRKELALFPEGSKREAEVQRLAEEYQDQGRATNAASVFEIDDVIDPADTRSWIVRTIGEERPREPGHRPVDTW